MVTTRTPIRRPARMQITRRAVALFQRMQECASHDDWWTLHGELHTELKLPPWCWPAIADPTIDDHRDGASGAALWRPEAQALWRELEKLCAA